MYFADALIWWISYLFNAISLHTRVKIQYIHIVDLFSLWTELVSVKKIYTRKFEYWALTKISKTHQICHKERFLLSYKMWLLTWEHVGWLQIFTSWIAPPDLISQSFPQLCSKTPAVFFLSYLTPSPMDHEDLFLPNWVRYSSPQFQLSLSGHGNM